MDEVSLVGKTIVAVRQMTKDEVEAKGWYRAAPVLHLSDGTHLYPSSDEEGNNAGALFGVTRKGDFFEVRP